MKTKKQGATKNSLSIIVLKKTLRKINLLKQIAIKHFLRYHYFFYHSDFMKTHMILNKQRKNNTKQEI